MSIQEYWYRVSKCGTCTQARVEFWVVSVSSFSAYYISPWSRAYGHIYYSKTHSVIVVKTWQRTTSSVCNCCFCSSNLGIPGWSTMRPYPLWSDGLLQGLKRRGVSHWEAISPIYTAFSEKGISKACILLLCHYFISWGCWYCYIPVLCSLGRLGDFKLQD